MNDLHMDTFNESSNDMSNMMTNFYPNEDSNLIAGESFNMMNDDNASNGITSQRYSELNDDSQTSGCGELRTCYCGKERNLDLVELQCGKCLRWFHDHCINTIKVGKMIKFMTSYTFFCKICSPNQMESFTKRQTNFSQICQTALANLAYAHRLENRIAFSKDKEIIPFIEKYWDILSTMPRRVKNTWHSTVFKTMSKDSETFMCDNRDPDDILFALRSMDLSKIAPNYDSQKINLNFVKNENGNGGPVVRSSRVKRRANQDAQNETISGSKKAKSDLAPVKLPVGGFPTEFPYNKDTFRYFLAEPDINAPLQEEFIEKEKQVEKITPPGFLFRLLLPDKVVLAMHDRAQQLKLSEDRLTVVGEKGYSTVRANCSVASGVWYYEMRINEMPDNSAVRLGWAQELANLQAPVGFDKFGYSWRSRKGTVFHQSYGKHYMDGGFGVGDILGCLIDLPSRDATLEPYRPLLPKTCKDKQIFKFKNYPFFEQKDDTKKALKELVPQNGSKICFYKNGHCQGVAFENIYEGRYFPTASAYKNISITFNFGPDFESPPTDHEYADRYRPMSDALYVWHIEQALSDIIYFIENDGKLTLEGC